MDTSEQFPDFNTELKRLSSRFGKKHRGFGSKPIFVEWVEKALIQQKCCCYYCETPISLIRELIDKDLLKSRKTGYGRRGRVLEIDKKTNDLGYNLNNCVLACYYCNNDKSNIFDAEDFRSNFGPNRKRYFLMLLEKSRTITNG